MPMMPFIGVRISWLMPARNRVFWLLASSACSLATRNCSPDASNAAVRASTRRCISVRYPSRELAMWLNALAKTPTSSLDESDARAEKSPPSIARAVADNCSMGCTNRPAKREPAARARPHALMAMMRIQ